MQIRFSNVSKEFKSEHRRVNAINNLNLEIHDKEFFVLLGPSGCGKSTVLNLLSGLEPISHGSLTFDEKLVSSIKPKKFLSAKERNIAMVFQNYALYPHLSVRDNIGFPLKMMRESKATIVKGVESTAEILNISELLNAKPKELSGGQRQRVAIARALIRRPSLFLLDEPLSNLDAQLRTLMREELKALQRKVGITTVYVTHDQIEAMTLGDRIGLLKDGHLEQVGTPEEMYEKPRTPFVASFLGSPPMNLLECKITGNEFQPEASISGIAFRIPENDLRTLKKAGISNKCLLGIRPEDIHLQPQENIDKAIKASVASVESLGREKLVRLEVEGQILFALTRAWDSRQPETVVLEFQKDKLHFFPVD